MPVTSRARIAVLACCGLLVLAGAVGVVADMATRGDWSAPQLVVIVGVLALVCRALVDAVRRSRRP